MKTEDKNKIVDNVFESIYRCFFGVLSEATIKKEYLENLKENLKIKVEKV